LIGRTTNVPDVRYTPSNKQVATFTLAVDRDFKNAQGEKEADFLPCVVWGKLAEVCEKYLEKGKQCAVVGRIQILFTYLGQLAPHHAGKEICFTLAGLAFEVPVYCQCKGCYLLVIGCIPYIRILCCSAYQKYLIHGFPPSQNVHILGICACRKIVCQSYF
jgi:primosomal replication protein N